MKVVIRVEIEVIIKQGCEKLSLGGGEWSWELSCIMEVHVIMKTVILSAHRGGYVSFYEGEKWSLDRVEWS